MDKNIEMTMPRKTTIPKRKIFRTAQGWKIRGQLGYSVSKAKAQARYRALRRKVRGAKGVKVIGRTMKRVYTDVGGLFGIQANVLTGSVVEKTQASITAQLFEEEKKREATIIGIARKKAGLKPAHIPVKRLPKVRWDRGKGWKVEGIRGHSKDFSTATDKFHKFHVQGKTIKAKTVGERYIKGQLGGRFREAERALFGHLDKDIKREQKHFLRLAEQREQELKMR